MNATSTAYSGTSATSIKIISGRHRARWPTAASGTADSAGRHGRRAVAWLVLAGGQRGARDALRRPAPAPDPQLPYKLGTLLSPWRQQSAPDSRTRGGPGRIGARKRWQIA